MKTVGQLIENLLDNRDMTQRQLADLIGVSEVTISRYINGARQPKSDILAKIASVLGVSTDYLLGNEKENIQAIKQSSDISDKLDQLKRELETEDTLMFDGAPATAEQIEAILNALEMGKAYASQKAKEKFTRKDYR